MNRRHFLGLGLGGLGAPAWAEVAQCVVPAKPGGGFDVTCQLLRELLAGPGRPLKLVYQPGGIGALTYQEVVRGTRGQVRELVAFSSGSLLNLAQGRFGPWRPERIRWVAGLALDHGVVAVHRDAPWRSLPELQASLQRDPAAVAFAAGGTIGSQDWMKAALLAHAAGVSHKMLRVVAFEGGGDAVRALEGRHVQVLCGDAAELSMRLAQGGSIRLLGVLAAARLPGRLAAVPTAREQGVEVLWPILRGVYASADFPAPELAAVRQTIHAAQKAPAYSAQVHSLGLQPLALTGDEFQLEVERQLQHYRREAERFGLRPRT